jgi:hypothetical protein
MMQRSNLALSVGPLFSKVGIYLFLLIVKSRLQLQP